MWPTLRDGDEFTIVERPPEIDDIVVFRHPLKNEICIKRVKSIEGERLFVEGDNPDPTASEDSHNFGTIRASEVIGVRVD